ncbi:MAG: LysE family transporter [Firmicutes bacterium]|nr:LysE family transporter [Bacillota bacterium]
MYVSILLSYLPYAAVTAYTPGPNNILAINTVSNYGWKQGRVVLLGIGAGFLSVMTISAMLCLQVSHWLESFTHVMKYAGAIYIFWLAIHIARSKPGEGQEKGKQGFIRAFILQFANVKIILYSITVYTAYVIPQQDTVQMLLLSAAFNTMVGISGSIVWAGMGGLLQKQIKRHYRLFNIIMALILVESGIRILL